MLSDIFISTSCRYKQVVKLEPYHHYIHHTHNTTEFIQYIKYIKDDLNIPSHLQSKVFRSQYLKTINKQPLIDIDKSRLLQEYNRASTVIVEICSGKIYQQDRFYLHHLAVDGGDSASFSENYQGNFQIQTDQDLYNDLKDMKQIVSDKKILVTTHINPANFLKRSQLIDKLSKFCQDLEICFYNAAEIIGPEDTTDVNHLNQTGHKKQALAIARLLQE